jgi:hypothetical protein
MEYILIVARRKDNNEIKFILPEFFSFEEEAKLRIEEIRGQAKILRESYYYELMVAKRYEDIIR